MIVKDGVVYGQSNKPVNDLLGATEENIQELKEKAAGQTVITGVCNLIDRMGGVAFSVDPVTKCLQVTYDEPDTPPST